MSGQQYRPDMQAVALAVLHRALADACGSMPDFSRATSAHRKAREEARQFWEAEDGEWAISREILCDAAGVHPVKARKEALRKIAAHKQHDNTRNVKHFLKSRAERNAKIRQRKAAGERVEDLAIAYGLSMTTVYDIVNPTGRAK